LLRTTKVQESQAQELKQRAPEAFKELDRVTKPAEVSPVKSDSISVVTTAGTSNTFNLMPVDNAEYKARRAEAIQKPGAVVGQVSVQ
jgi:hypothetical protein